MTDNRVRAAASPSPATGGASVNVAAWGGPHGQTNTASEWDAHVGRGLVFMANSGTLTAPTSGQDALVSTEPDLLIDVPDGTSIKPLMIRVSYETVGTTALSECVASFSANLGVQTGGTGITATNMRSRGGGSTNCTITETATATTQATNVTEFYRHQIQLVEDMVATEVGWEDRNFVWAAGKDGPAPLLVGESSLMIWGATQNTTLFVQVMWVEFQGSEY